MAIWPNTLMNANDIAHLDLVYRGFYLKDELCTFSRIQMDICFDLLNGLSWKRIQNKYNIKSPNTVQRCILRTAGGYRWNHGNEVGRKRIISDADEKKFVDLLIERATDGNCVPTYEAIVIARNLMEGRLMRAEYLLNKFHCPKLLAKFEVYDSIFDIHHLTSICDQYNLRLSNPQTIEELRKKYCEYNDINNFYDFIAPHATTPPHLTFNADETTVVSHSNSKVITLRGKLPLKPDKKFNLHMTAMCCFNAIGAKVPLFIILKNLQSLPQELKNLNIPVYYAASRSGWMTKELFTAWSIHFIAWTATYRATYLHTYFPQDEDKQILLYLDGHGSRINYHAMKLFQQNNIKVVTLRPHTTHLCQPFDRVIASPLKRYIKEYSYVWNHRYPQISYLTGARLERAKAILCLYDAFEKAVDLSNAESAFRSTGLIPFDKNVVLNNTNYVFNRPLPNQPGQQNLQNQLPNALNIRRRTSRYQIGEKVTTDENILRELLQLEFPGYPLPRVIPYVQYPVVKHRLLTNIVDKGKMLSQFMGFLIRYQNGMMEYI